MTQQFTLTNLFYSETQINYINKFDLKIEKKMIHNKTMRKKTYHKLQPIQSHVTN